jgi:paraquat-inducible protein A
MVEQRRAGTSPRDRPESTLQEPTDNARRRRSWLYRTSWVLLPVSLVLYLSSLGMDVAEVHKTLKIFGVGRTDVEAVRLLSTIRTLFQDGETFLALILTSFTLFFPLSKYVALFFILLGRDRRRRGRILTAVKNLGQWSMGDVFVVALLVVMMRLNSGVAEVSVKVLPGLWVFAVSVLLTMIVSALLGFLESRESERIDRGAPEL